MPITDRLEIADRRDALEHAPDVAALGRRLARLAAPILERPVYIPEQKALLSKDGGICPVDGSRLAFDPLSPHLHTCPECGAIQGGQRHHRAWVWRYHLWLSERAIHLAVLEALGVKPGAGSRAREILAEYARRYSSYPNADNVLGPTRLFFSTYLESIWLLQIVIAGSLLQWDDGDAGRSELEAVVLESSTLIASFDEGWSNRQVWNSAALVAAGGWLDDQATLDRGLESEHGIKALLTHAVSDSGRWHEGENYHFFALRGVLLAAEVLRPLGTDLYRDEPWAERLARMYVAPLATVLPDLSLPARGDSPFAVTLMQSRFAELWEVGWARTKHSALASVLGALYQSEDGAAEDPGFTEIAEVEQNRLAQRLTRSDLGWKALLWMDERAPEVDPAGWQRGSVVIEERGPMVLRTDTGRYVSLEGGGTGTGHGHPDALNLTIFWKSPWLLDFGTGSYVAQSLHWYRSTLAHNAPGRAGVGQLRGYGWCAAFDVRGDWGWCRGVAEELLGPDTRAVRSVIAGPDYVLDVIDLSVAADCVVDLPLHLLGPPPLGLDAETAGDSANDFLSKMHVGHENGYDAVADVRRLETPPEQLRCTAGQNCLIVMLAHRSGESCFVMRAPGPPTLAFADSDRKEFLVRRASGSGRWVQLYTPCPDVFAAVESQDGAIRIVRKDGSVETVTLAADQMEVNAQAPGAGERPIVRLKGSLPRPAAPKRAPRQPRRIRCELLERLPTLHAYFETVSPDTVLPLGEANYRRSEVPFPGDTELSGQVAVSACGNRLLLGVEVHKRELVFRAVDEPDPLLDNEAPDIHSDGVQCYFDCAGWRGYVAIPEEGSDMMRIRPIAGTMAEVGDVTGRWARTKRGYAALLEFVMPQALSSGQAVTLNIVVNEMRPGRQRRTGQLALAGGGGWVYLRGDRESPAAAVIAEVS